MKRKIIVTITREARVEVEIDDSIVDKKTLIAISSSFEDLEDTDTWDPTFEIDDTDDTEMYNYARIAAMDQLGINSDFINLKAGHTVASIAYEDLTADFEDRSKIIKQTS